MPFITAGYPDLETTEALLADFERRGVRICEIGIPFSDPIADGPIIQASFTEALERGVTVAKIFQAIRRYRVGGGKMALTAMGSYSIIFRHGPAAYIKEAAEAGFDGLIVPDLPVEEAGAIEPMLADAGMANILLIAPTTPQQRRLAIAARSQAFIYYISVAGTTGQRTSLPPETADAVAQLRKHTDTPICVGFGISSPETVESICKAADGAIVGSAIVRRITEHKNEPREALVEKVGQFVSELIKPLLM
jgi:tryptophan synthase alpha chain